MATIRDVTDARTAAKTELTKATGYLSSLLNEKGKVQAEGQKKGAVAAAAEGWIKFAAAFKAANEDVNTPEARDAADEAREAAAKAEDLARQAIHLYASRFP